MSIANGGRNENTDIQEKAENCTANEEDVAKLIQWFEEIIKNKESDIVWLAYFIAWKFRVMKILRFRGRVQKTAKLKCREKCILSWTAKLKCREKSFDGQPRN